MSDTIPYTEKYAPKSSSEIVGHTAIIAKIKRFIESYKTQKKKGLLLYGPPGCGKTSTVYAIAQEMGLETIEVNASDSRNKDSIQRIVGNASSQMSLFGTSKLILIDEVDGLAGNKDRGGVAALVKILKSSRYPMIMTCNDPYDKKYSPLRKEADVLQFEELEYSDVMTILKRVCEKENIQYEESTLKQLARMAGGDVRGALNDLQTVTPDGKLTSSDLDLIGERVKKESIQDALFKVMKMTDPQMARTALMNIDESFDEQIMWLDENIPREYTKKEDYARAYDVLSRVDVYRGRIRRRQNWRFLATMGTLMSSGIAVSKDEKYAHRISYQKPTRILEMWKANMFNQKKKAISEKLAGAMRMSKKRAQTDILPYVRFLAKKDKDFCETIAVQLDLSTDEKEWLRK